MAGAVLGLNCVLSRNTGTSGTPVWDAVPNVRDVTLNLTNDEADVTRRASGGFKERMPTLSDASIDFEMVWDTGDTDFTAIRTAFTAKTALELLVLDGPSATTGSQGLRAACGVFNFTREENIADAVKVKVSMKPMFSSTFSAPSWYTAA